MSVKPDCCSETASGTLLHQAIAMHPRIASYWNLPALESLDNGFEKIFSDETTRGICRTNKPRIKKFQLDKDILQVHEDICER
jgi:hypothetical protein